MEGHYFVVVDLVVLLELLVVVESVEVIATVLPGLRLEQLDSYSHLDLLRVFYSLHHPLVLFL